jgi:hypothetical protein
MKHSENDKYDEDIYKLPPVQESIKSVEISPNPGFSIKTKNDSNKIAYLNICSHNKVSKPYNSSYLNDEKEEVEGLNIPISIDKCIETEIRSKPCLIFDIVVHPIIIDDCESDLSGKYRDFICKLAIEGVKKKFNYILNLKYKVLNDKYVGNLRSQRIRDKRVEEIDDISKDIDKTEQHSIVSTSKDASAIPNQKSQGIFGFKISIVNSTNSEQYQNIPVLLNTYVEPIIQYQSNFDQYLLLVNLERVQRHSIRCSISPYRLKVRIIFKTKVYLTLFFLDI